MKEDVLKFLAAVSRFGAPTLPWQLHDKSEKSPGKSAAIAAIENPADISIISSRNTSQRAVLILAADTGVSLVAGYIISGTFTNQIQVTFRKPRLLVVIDPRADNWVLRGVLYQPTYHVLYNTDSPLCCVDLAVPCIQCDG
ncbi:40S ribosomal protein SA [Lemmus lemmus]